MNKTALFASSAVIAIATAMSQSVTAAPSARAIVSVEPSFAPVVETAPALQNEPAVTIAHDVDADEYQAPSVHGPRNATFERAALTRAVETVAKIVDRRCTIPILSNVSLRQNGPAVEIIGTDMDLEIAVSVPSDVDTGFAATLPAHLFRDLLKKASKSEFVSIDLGDASAALDFERAQFNLQTLPVEDFPIMNGPGENAVSFAIPTADLFRSIDRTCAAISTEETRYYLNGIFFHAHQEGNRNFLRCVATDGHRLHCADTELPAGADAMPSVIIPTSAVNALHALLKAKDRPENAIVSVSHDKIRVSMGNMRVTSKLVDGTFPDYQRVMPRHNSEHVSLSGAALKEAVQTVSLISSERGRAVKMVLSNSNLRLVVNNPDAGSAHFDMPVSYEGDGMEIGFNNKYLLAIIDEAMVEGDAIRMELQDASSPGVFLGEGDNWRGVAMPMRI